MTDNIVIAIFGVDLKILEFYLNISDDEAH